MAIDKSMIKRLATQCRIKVINDGMMYVADKEPFEAYTRAIEQATREQLLAGVEVPEPVAVVRVHKTGGNPGLAWNAHPTEQAPVMRDGEPLYTADQMRTAIAAARAEQREKDAKVCEGYALRTRRYLDDDMTACKLADAIRKGGE